jgi:hypothetical protein
MQIRVHDNATHDSCFRLHDLVVSSIQRQTSDINIMNIVQRKRPPAAFGTSPCDHLEFLKMAWE